MGERFTKATGPLVRGDDPLPTAQAIRLAKDAALAGVVAAMAQGPWPPAEPGRQLVDAAPYIALALMEATCGDVGLPRLAVCLGLDAGSAPSALAEMRAAPSWPAIAFKAAMAAWEQGA
jgi:hypothetical protein